jgi:hypothetical protein
VNRQYLQSMRRHHRRDQLLWGLTLVAVGALFLLDRLDAIDLAGLWQYWPGWVALIGAAKLLPPTSPKQILGGLWLICLAAWWYVSYERLWGFSFQNSWPFFIIAWGAGLVLQPLLERLFAAKPDESNEEPRHELGR